MYNLQLSNYSGYHTVTTIIIFSTVWKPIKGIKSLPFKGKCCRIGHESIRQDPNILP